MPSVEPFGRRNRLLIFDPSIIDRPYKNDCDRGCTSSVDAAR